MKTGQSYCKSSSKRQFTALESYLQKQENSQINNMTSYLKELEKEETNTKVSRSDENSKKKKKKEWPESWFFEKINKIYKILERLIKKKRKQIQISKIRNERTEIYNWHRRNARLIRDYYKQLHDNKLDNLEEMHKSLERYKLPRLNREETEDINRPATSRDIETEIKNLPTNKCPGPGGFTGEFDQTFREVMWKSLSCIWLFAAPRTIQSMEFSRPEYWNG